MKASQFLPGTKFTFQPPYRKTPTVYELKEDAIIVVVEDVDHPDNIGERRNINVLDKGIELYDYCGSIRMCSQIIKFSSLELIPEEHNHPDFTPTEIKALHQLTDALEGN